MTPQQIALNVKNGDLRKKEVNLPHAKSLLRAAMDSADFAIQAKITERSATSVFKEFYDAFRQLGDAKWWMLGYESYSHKASIELLKDATVPLQQELQQLTRLRTLRDDASYRGYRIPIAEAQEIKHLWKVTSTSLIEWLELDKKL